MAPANIIAALKKCGIPPFKNNIVPEELFPPSKSFPKFEAEESSPTKKS